MNNKIIAEIIKYKNNYLINQHFIVTHNDLVKDNFTKSSEIPNRKLIASKSEFDIELYPFYKHIVIIK